MGALSRGSRPSAPGPEVLPAGARLRRRRLDLGLSLQEVAQTTRISVLHLSALEDDRLEDLPAGPYAGAFRRAVGRYLGLPDDPPSDDGRSRGPTEGVRLGVVRGMAAVSVVALVGLLVHLVWQRVSMGPSPAVAGGVVDQHITLVARRGTEVTAIVDGQVALERPLAEGDEIQLAGRDRIEIAVEAAEDVRIVWNGRAVVPQGLQDTPRWLVFVDDAGVLP